MSLENSQTTMKNLKLGPFRSKIKGKMDNKENKCREKSKKTLS